MANGNDALSNNYNALMDFSKFAINMSVIINAGAATALLAFFKGIPGEFNKVVLVDSIQYFVDGTVLGCVAIIAAFFTRWAYYGASTKKPAATGSPCCIFKLLKTLGGMFNVGAVVSTIGTYACFALGVSTAARSYAV